MSQPNGTVDDASLWIPIEPSGLSMALVATSSLFAGLTTVVIAMRVYIRLAKRGFGVDDWMMVGGYVSPHTFFCFYRLMPCLQAWHGEDGRHVK